MIKLQSIVTRKLRTSHIYSLLGIILVLSLTPSDRAGDELGSEKGEKCLECDMSHGSFDMVSNTTYTLPPTPTSHGSSFPDNGNTSGNTTDPLRAFAHPDSPADSIPGETTALSVRRSETGPAYASTRPAPLSAGLAQGIRFH